MLCRHRSFLSAVVLLSYLCRDFTVTNALSIIKEGSSYEKICNSDREMFFTYPTSRTNDSDTAFTYTSPVEISKFQYKNGSHSYQILRRNIVFGDTGWYGCSNKPILISNGGTADAIIDWNYLFVESETVRFVEQANLHNLVAIVGEDIVIPCRPTMPTVEVNLTKHDGNGKNEVLLDHDFDPKIGFTLRKIDGLQSGLYICTMEPDQKVSYNVVIAEENTLPEPEIIDNSGLMHINMGETLYLKCAILVPWGVDYDIYWMPLQQNKRVSSGFEKLPDYNGVAKKITVLEVKDVNYNDEGIYECRVKKGIFEKNSRTYVQVHGSLDAFVNLASRDSISYYRCYESGEVEWVVDVEAYPLPQLRWVHRNIDEVTKSLLPRGRSRFLIDSSCCQPKLRINRLKLSDMGTYSIQAFNQYKNVTLDFTLDVVARPKVYLRKQDSHYFQNQVAKIECHVEGFPKPNITWIYSKCPNYPICGDGTVEYLKNTKESGTVTRLLSTISATLDMAGGLTCNACNILGCRSVTEYVNFFDRREFGMELTKDTVLEGDDWELICYASIQNYLDFFDWSTDNGRIVSSGRITVSRGRTQSAYRSVLKIRNVNLQDSQEYICTGKSRNHWIRTSGYHLEVKAGRAPVIIDTNLEKNELIIDVTAPGHKGIEFHCIADGKPKPSISWFKDGIQLTVNNKEYKFSNNSQTLELDYLLEVDSGEYVCRAENPLGKTEVYQQVTIKGEGIVNNTLVGLIVLIVILAVVVVILIIYFIRMVHRERKIRDQLMKARPVRFQRAAGNTSSRNLYVDDPTGLSSHL